MSFLGDIPVIYKVLFSLFVILVLSRFFKTIIVPLCAGTITVALLTGYSPPEIYAFSTGRMLNLNSLALLFVFFEIMCLSIQMSDSGTFRKIVKILKGGLDKRKSMALLPAMIGLLPMPGGALFSAPLVDDCDDRKDTDPLLKAKINYWFRHIWEYWWPVYPGVILAIELTGLETWQFMLIQFPMSVATVVIGYFFLLRKVNADGESPASLDAKSIFQVLKLVSPIFMVIIVYGAVKLFFPAIGNLCKYIPMAVGLLCAICLLQWQSPLGFLEWKKLVLSKSIYSMLFLVTIILIYGAFIEGKLPDGTSVVEKIRMEITESGIPPAALFILIPFVCGMTTGLSIGFVGTSFPIVMSMLGETPSPGTVLTTAFLAYGSGYVGMLLSPVHVCLIVTNEHFKTQLSESLRKLAVPSMILLLVNFILFNLLKLVL